MASLNRFYYSVKNVINWRFHAEDDPAYGTEKEKQQDSVQRSRVPVFQIGWARDKMEKRDLLEYW